ncbi:MAG: hypothetical protein HOW73_31365 [Polyangiaceae bacterium]|nr:hypothetical protein [Polyangiaceae bacterium]
MRPLSSKLAGAVLMLLAPLGCDPVESDPNDPPNDQTLECEDNAHASAGECVCDEGYEPSDGTEACVLPTPSTSGLLFVRGVAGVETLFFSNGEIEVPLSAGGGVSYCDGKIYCDLPPAVVASKILYFDFLDLEHAVFVEGDPADWTNSAIYSVELATGARTLLSENVQWKDEPDARQGWVYSFAKRGEGVYLSVRAGEGMVLLRTNGPGEELAVVQSFALPEGTYPIGSTVEVGDNAIAWSVETANAAPNPDIDFRHFGWVLDEDDNVRISYEDAPDGFELGDPFQLRGSTVITPLWNGVDPYESTTWVIDTNDFTARTMLPDSSRFPLRLSPDGRWLVTRDAADGYSFDVYELESGEHKRRMGGKVIDYFPLDNSKMLVNADGARLVLEDVDGSDPDVVLYDGTKQLIGFESFDQPETFFSADGKTLVTITGERYPEYATDIGIAAVDVATQAVTEIRPPAISDLFIRQMRLSADGNEVVFLDPFGPSLDIVSYDLTTKTERTLVASGENERLFVLGAQLW